MRILPQGTLFDSIEHLVTSRAQQELVYANLNNARMVLIAGAKKTGVTRTYYGILEHISAKQKEVISIEDPVEVVLPRISQLAAGSKKDSKKLFMQTMLARPDVIGLAPFNLAYHAPLFASIASGTQAVFETETMQNFITTLENNKLFTTDIVSALSLIFSHATFRSVDEAEVSKRSLTSSEIATLTKYISAGECINYLRYEGAISDSVNKLQDVQITARKKVSVKKRKEKEYRTRYVRGVTTGENILRQAGSPLNKVQFQKQARISEKRSVLENALLRSIAGEVCIKDIFKYLNN